MTAPNRKYFRGHAIDWSHYRFVRKSGLRHWHFAARKSPVVRGLAEFLGWVVAFLALFFLFAVALGA